ncbi:hypothetical protein MC885_002945 [Smutsia gigantea]|nr:hypothetical protein MC885_002945 [Smutsia gigantea]
MGQRAALAHTRCPAHQQPCGRHWQAANGLVPRCLAHPWLAQPQQAEIRPQYGQPCGAPAYKAAHSAQGTQHCHQS